MKILVVEDEEEMASALVEALEDACYAVDLATTGRQAEELVDVHGGYDLVMLDWRIPTPNGLELVRKWRAAGSEVPVLMLTGRTEVGDRVDGLDAGADDYLTKPFSFVELLARVRTLLRRRPKPHGPLRAADLEVDPATRKVRVAGELLELSPKEYSVVEYLLRRLGETVSRGELAEHVWNGSAEAMSNTIDVIVYRLRKKIDGNRSRRLLHTIKGVGYVLQAERC